MNVVTLGRINGVFGVKGWVKVFSYTEPREALADYQQAYCSLADQDDWQAVQIEAGQRHGKTVILKLQGVNDREAAAAYVGQDVGVPRTALAELPEGQYYWADLLGCVVHDLDGSALGSVTDLLETGANDVLQVKTPQGIELIPWVLDDIVRTVDMAKQLIVVDWQLGYFDDDDE